jgi:hypothetical protein
VTGAKPPSPIGLEWLAIIGRVGLARPSVLAPDGRWHTDGHDPARHGLTGALLLTEQYMAARIEGTPAELDAWAAAVRDAVNRDAVRTFARRPLVRRTSDAFRIAWRGRSSYIDRQIEPRMIGEMGESQLDSDLADLIRALGGASLG